MKDELELLRDARPAVAGPSIELTRLARADLMRTVTRRASAWRTKRLAVVGVPAAAAIIAAVAISATLLTRGGDEAWAAALVNVAESAPRLLPDQPGWQVTHADEFNIQFGEMTFSQGQRELALRWQPASTYQGMLHKRAIEADLATSLPVAGADARVFRDQGTEVFSALWERGGYAIEVYDTARKLEDFKFTLGSFHEVDIDTWLSALPASVIKPANRAQVVDQMLADVPLPPRFNVATLRSGEAIHDRYQLGAQVSGAIGCAWIDEWLTARHAGDEARARQAVSAMATSHKWAVLQEMKANGDYPEVVWQYAAAMTTNRPVLDKATVAESYKSALGCPGS